MTEDTKYLLAHTFAKLMEHKPIDQIRVVEIAQAAGFSKQTFYRHFVDKYDLMDYCFRKMFDNQLDMIAKGEPITECYDSFFSECRDRRGFMHNAFSSTDVNGLFRAMRYAVREAFGERVVLMGGVDEGEVTFMLDFYVKGFVGATRRWLERGMDVPKPELITVLIKCLPAEIKKFIK